MVRDIQRILSHKESKHPAGHPKVPPKQIQKKNETQKLLFRESPRGLRKDKFCRSGLLVASKIMPFREVSWESPRGLLRKHKKKKQKKKLKAAAGVETHGKQGAAIGMSQRVSRRQVGMVLRVLVFPPGATRMTGLARAPPVHVSCCVTSKRTRQ